MTRLAGLVLAAALAGGEATAQTAWPYDFGEPGRVATRRDVPDLGVTFLTFENGVRVTVKPMSAKTPLERDKVQVHIRMGHGSLDQSPMRMDGARSGWMLMSASGLRKLNRADHDALIAARGTCAIVGFMEFDDAFAMTGLQDPHWGERDKLRGYEGEPSCAPDLAFLFSYMAARLTDSDYSFAPWRKWLDNINRNSSGPETYAFGEFVTKGELLLHSGDLRWNIYDSRDMPNWKHADALAFIKPIVETAPLEVIVAGDVTVEQVATALAPSIGALPPRTAAPEPDGLRTARFPEPREDTIVYQHSYATPFSFVVVACPGQGVWEDYRAWRTTTLMSGMLSSRIDARLPGDQSMKSAASVGFDLATNYGRMQITGVAVPGEEEEAETAIFDEMARLRTELVDEADLAAAKGRTLASMADDLSELSTWLFWLPHADVDPRRLDALRDWTGVYARATPEDIRATARQWLDPAKCLRFRIVPQGR